MREILFRGKRSDTGQWVEGSLLIDGVTGQYFIHSNDDTVNESDKVGEEGCLRFFAFEVDPETVGQYTGFTNRNGVKIFEGDIVRAYVISGEIVTKEVTYNEDLAAFVVGGYPLSKITALRKVGNIYDNPKLLEVEQ